MKNMILALGLMVVCSQAYSATTTYYEIWRNTTDDPGTATRIVPATPTRIEDLHTETSYDDLNVVRGRHYFYWIRALACEEADAGGYVGTSNLNVYIKMICPIYTTKDFYSPVYAYAWLRGDYFGDISKDVTFTIYDYDEYSFFETIESWTESADFTGDGFANEWYKDVNIENYSDGGEAEVFLSALFGPFSFADTQPIVETTKLDIPVAGPTGNASSGTYTDKIHLSWSAPTTDICSEITATPSFKGWTDDSGSLTVTLAPSSGQWRLTSGSDTSWKSSGASISNISPGTYTVSFSNVAGYSTPSPRSITIGTGSNSLSVTYQDDGNTTLYPWYDTFVNEHYPNSKYYSAGAIVFGTHFVPVFDFIFIFKINTI